MQNIQKIETLKSPLWDGISIEWTTVHPDVNIVVGVNGSGKTTMLENIYKTYKDNGGNIIYLRSIDNTPLRDKRLRDNALMQELNQYVYDLKKTPSLFRYRMRQLDIPGEAELINSRIKDFLSTTNVFFRQTGKELIIANNKLEVCCSNRQVIDLDLLSSGEKWLILLLLRVFLTEETPALILIDEPESSLHISWQQDLVNGLVKMNPNAQFIITTHSPSIFAKGWQDKIVFIDDIKTA